MFGKKSENEPAASETLGLWQNLNRHLGEFLSSSRVDLRTLPSIDIKGFVEVAISAKSRADIQRAIENLKSQFEQGRSQETLHLNEYIAGLRALLWSSLNQASSQLVCANRESERFERLRDKMVRALDSDDLMQLKLAVKDWIVLQNQISQERQRKASETQTHFQHQLSRLQNELYQTQMELKLDGLTQVYNRKAFDAEIVKTLQIAQLSARAATLLLIDIDHFKHVNDTYGHPVGDKVLQKFAKLIVQNFPMRTDFVARYGGEEFVVLMSECDEREAIAKAQKFVNLLRKTSMTFGGVTLRVTVSIGAAVSHSDDTAEDWVKRADLLLYRAKEGGRDCFKIEESAA